MDLPCNYINAGIARYLLRRCLSMVIISTAYKTRIITDRVRLPPATSKIMIAFHTSVNLAYRCIPAYQRRCERLFKLILVFQVVSESEISWFSVFIHANVNELFSKTFFPTFIRHRHLNL